MSYYTAVILPKGSNIVANSMMTDRVIVVENYGQLQHKLRGRGVNKVVLVNLIKDEVDKELLNVLNQCGKTFNIETGTDVPFVEV